MLFVSTIFPDCTVSSNSLFQRGQIRPAKALEVVFQHNTIAISSKNHSILKSNDPINTIFCSYKPCQCLKSFSMVQVILQIT